MDRNRRRVLRSGLAVPAALLLPKVSATPTPGCGEKTRSQTAGPFHTLNSPQKADFRVDDSRGRPVSLQAIVLDRRCVPLTGAVVDLWHADSQGRYDNDGYRLRGHQRADDDGTVRFSTIRPGNYGGRTPHYHVRILGPRGGTLLTTQLYFPDEHANRDDWLFHPALVLELATDRAETPARFTFVVET